MFFIALSCVFAAVLLSSCNLFRGDDIAAVRARAEKLRQSLSRDIVQSIEDGDVARLKSLFCPKSRQLPDIDAQIESTLSFINGNMKSYNVASSIGFEDYASEFGRVDQYSFGNDIYISTDASKSYRLYFNVHYIFDDDSVKGMTFYSISEWDNDESDVDEKRCAGYPWSSPYDAECGLLTASILKALASKNAQSVKALLCDEILLSPSIDGEIQKLFDFVDGAPSFTERADGLYNLCQDDDALNCRALAFENVKDANGRTVAVWIHALAQPVCTDSGQKYELDFVAYISNENSPAKQGVSCLSLENRDTGEKTSVGDWIR